MRARASGFVLGVLIWLALGQLGIVAIPPLRHHWECFLLPAGAAGALLIGPAARRLVWAFAGILALALVLITATPLVQPGVRALVREDPLLPADAVVVLGSWIEPNGAPSRESQERLLRAYELLAAGMAPCLVVTRLPEPLPSYVPAVRAQMQRIGLRHPLHETERVRNTHDEAVVAAKLARREGWRRVILVTGATHTRRGGALFEKVGLSVQCAPSDDRAYEVRALQSPFGRLAAYRRWLWESIGWHVYRRRGWI
ncbi:MAG: YdcF family protein [Armatimonadetes bacterium]|nr:YdcF family protein [Armatimonadota bacterium]